MRTTSSCELQPPRARAVPTTTRNHFDARPTSSVLKLRHPFQECVNGCPPHRRRQPPGAGGGSAHLRARPIQPFGKRRSTVLEMKHSAATRRSRATRGMEKQGAHEHGASGWHRTLRCLESIAKLRYF